MADLRPSRLIPDAVALRAASQPDALAVASPGLTLSYRQLDAAADRLAAHLRSLGVSRGDRIGLCVERSAALVVGGLGILRAGGAYVALDPGQPAHRLNYMLEDSGARVVLTSSAVRASLSAPAAAIIVLDAAGSPVGVSGTETQVHRAASHIGPDDLAYIIYTSGSTGRPKGVEVTHGNLMNLIAWHREAFAIMPADRATQIASPGFDASVWEIWPYLATGASVHTVPDAVRTTPSMLLEWLVAERITVSFAPTPLAERLIDLSWPSTAPLRLLLTGGDTLHRYPPKGLPFQLVNNYGPTESTVVATSGVVPPDDDCFTSPSIGRPIANVQIHILGADLRPVAPGTVGEIHIGGDSVARGYVGRPDLTGERFIASPFGGADARLYKTGDLACQLPDGQIAFRGRLDEQIKIRGYRIEPAEIVSALNAHASVVTSTVVVETGEPRRLIAYVVLEPGTRPTHSALCEFLTGRLPEYMIPASFFSLDRLPLNGSGKVDKTALPTANEERRLTDDEQSRAYSDLEARVAAILSRLLSVPVVGLDDNFFRLGGHSLMAAQVVTKVRQEFGIELTLRDLFRAPSVRQLAAVIEERVVATVGDLSEADVERLLTNAGADTIPGRR